MTATALRERIEEMADEARSPQLPGDLEQWARRVREQLSPLRGMLDDAHQREHETLEEIRKTDPELSGRVDSLERRVRGLREEFDAIEEGLGRVLQETTGGPSYGEPTASARAVRRRVLQWAAQQRELEVEVRTWLTEAHFRDRGLVD